MNPSRRFKPNWRAIRVGSAILAFLLLVTLYPPVQAAELDLQWSLSTTDCGGNTSPAAITDLEIYVSTVPIPASDLACPSSGPVDVPPSGGTVIQTLTPDPGDTGVRITVPDGATYYIRARVRDVNGEWSNLSSPERVFDAPFPVPGAPTITVISL